MDSAICCTCIMGSHNFKGTARGLFGVDHAQEGNIDNSLEILCNMNNTLQRNKYSDWFNSLTVQ